MAVRWPNAAVLVFDLKSFTSCCAEADCNCVAEYLQRLFMALDDAVESFGVERIDIVGDAYIAVAHDGDDACKRAARFALCALEITKRLPFSAKSGPMAIRVALHVGPVDAIVLDAAPGKYHLIGPTFNETTSLERSGHAGHIHCSPEALAMLLA